MEMEELGECELGDQEYWEKRYKEEINNFRSHGDPGEVWFGEDIVARILKWMEKCEKITNSSRILDLGCGNGMFLVELASEGYTNLYGVDYSEGAIILARSLAQKHELDINFSTCNILEHLEGKFDLIHDKGTYDAISLNANAKEFRAKYIENVSKSMTEDSFFVITSCNWTKSELYEHFKNDFECVSVIPTPQFKFGGQTGSVVTSIVCQLKSK